MLVLTVPGTTFLVHTPGLVRIATTARYGDDEKPAPVWYTTAIVAPDTAMVGADVASSEVLRFEDSNTVVASTRSRSQVAPLCRLDQGGVDFAIARHQAGDTGSPEVQIAIMSERMALGAMLRTLSPETSSIYFAF
mgnify:CR=1 FL=1